MEYQKIINLEYTNGQVKFKTTMLKSSLCDYGNHAHLLTLKRLGKEGDNLMPLWFFQKCSF